MPNTGARAHWVLDATKGSGAHRGNERQATAAGPPVTDTHLALHVGELLYGNLGSPRRLDFTVLGSAVNEAARIEALCASLDQKVIVRRRSTRRPAKRASGW